MLPALEEGYLSNAPPPWLIVDLRPGDAPLDRLAEAFLKAQPQPEKAAPPVEHAEAMLAATLRRGPRGFVDALRESHVPGDANVLLLVDQFEELFRFRDRTRGAAPDHGGSTQRGDRVRRIAAANGSANRAADLCGHHDALGLFGRLRRLPRTARSHQRRPIPRPASDARPTGRGHPASGTALRRAIDEPLVNRLLNQLGNDPDQLPVLQHALMRMWMRKQAALASTSGPLSLTADDYALTGGLEDALSQHADEAYNSLDATGQRIAERMFRCLSEGSPTRLTRRLATIQEIADVAQVSVDEVIAVADAFRRPDRCFLTPPANVPLTAQSTLDISHESLLRLWRRMADWVRAEATSRERYRDLCRRAELHQSGGDLLGRQDLQPLTDMVRPRAADSSVGRSLRRQL